MEVARGKHRVGMIETRDSSSAKISVPTERGCCWPPQNDGIGGICHSVGATRSRSKPVRTICSVIVPETTATEESPDAGWQEKQQSVIGLKVNPEYK
ncbi:MAG: hypothetical protein MUD09_00215 [Desulfobacterales bacterium]|nr:hypothetical protein [Desulfobacterales bacterium]